MIDRRSSSECVPRVTESKTYPCTSMSAALKPEHGHLRQHTSYYNVGPNVPYSNRRCHLQGHNVQHATQDVDAKKTNGIAIVNLQVRSVLNDTKHPSLAGEVSHRYEDKFLLVEYLTDTAIASGISCLTELGCTPDKLTRAREWAASSAVFLVFNSSVRCALIEKREKEVTGPKHVVEKETLKTRGADDVIKVGMDGGMEVDEPSAEKEKTIVTSTVVTTVEEYAWQVGTSPPSNPPLPSTSTPRAAACPRISKHRFSIVVS